MFSSGVRKRLGVTRTPSTPMGGMVIDKAAPPGGNGRVGKGGGGGGTIIGGGATFTGGGAHAATALMIMMAARFLTPIRIQITSRNNMRLTTGFLPP